MKETVRSLKAYFILSGLLSGAQNMVALEKSGGIIATVIAIVGIGFAVAYIFTGVRLRSLLAKAPQKVLNLLIAGAVFLAALFGVAALYGTVVAAAPIVVTGLLITWYLFVNIRRLSAESRPAATAPVSP